MSLIVWSFGRWFLMVSTMGCWFIIAVPTMLVSCRRGMAADCFMADVADVSGAETVVVSGNRSK